MKLKIQNGELKKIDEFLQTLALSGKASRGKVKLKRRVLEKLNEFSVDFESVRNDEETDQTKRNEQLIELIKEDAVIDMSEYANQLTAFKDALEDYGEKMQGDDAIAHDVLLDALETEIEETQYQEVE